MRKPRVSVVMSCFNGARWLPASIESILAQSHADFEFVLVDDGSEDGTWDIIQGYRNTDHRIISVKKRNSGLSESLNVGLRLASGDWIVRIDQDDFCEVNRIERQLGYLKENPDVVLLGTWAHTMGEYGDISGKHRYPQDHQRLVRRLLNFMSFFPHSSGVYCRDSALRVGGYDPLFPNAQDYRLWLALSRLGRIACYPDYLVRIRKHEAGLSQESAGWQAYFQAIAAIALDHRLEFRTERIPNEELRQLAETTLDYAMHHPGIEKRFRAEVHFLHLKRSFELVLGKNRAIDRGSVCVPSWGLLSTVLVHRLFGSDIGRQIAVELERLE